MDISVDMWEVIPMCVRSDIEEVFRAEKEV
jgi:hypothetical protein